MVPLAWVRANARPDKTAPGAAGVICLIVRGSRDYVCILCVVTRLNVYLPDDLAAQAKEAGLNLSAVTQAAVRQTLAARSTDSWLSATLHSVSTSTVAHKRALEAIDEVRDEAPTRHG